MNLINGIARSILVFLTFPSLGAAASLEIERENSTEILEFEPFSHANETLEIELNVNPYFICFPYLEENVTLDSFMPTSLPLKTYRELGFSLTNMTETVGNDFSFSVVDFCIPPGVWNENLLDSITIDDENVINSNNSIYVVEPTWLCDVSNTTRGEFELKSTILFQENETIVEVNCCLWDKNYKAKNATFPCIYKGIIRYPASPNDDLLVTFGRLIFGLLIFALIVSFCCKG